MLFFDQTDVTVNGTGILAQSASLDIASNVLLVKEESSTKDQ